MQSGCTVSSLSCNRGALLALSCPSRSFPDADALGGRLQQLACRRFALPRAVHLLIDLFL